MKKLIIRLLKYVMDKAKRSKFIQNIFEAPFDLEKFEDAGIFKDSFGNTHGLKSGLRSKIKPGWQNMLKKRKRDISDASISKLASNGSIAIGKIEPILNTFGKSINGSRVLEIGCHAGSNSFNFTENEAIEVVGTEFSGYKMESINEDGINDSGLHEVNEDLKVLRNKLGKHFSNNDNVTFVDDDICNSKLLKNSFDIICSWEVLEHLHDPKKAFVNISSMLKDDGIAIHEYNPFFCLNGGHSLCTLDFLWGHVRLNEQDFTRYLKEFRPNEKKMALSFFRKGLNRMTIRDLFKYLEDSGLEIVSFLPYTKEQHIRMVDKEILKQCTRNYPNLTFTDLVTPKITFITKKIISEEINNN